jgi:hypothetical protein
MLERGKRGLAPGPSVDAGFSKTIEGRVPVPFFRASRKEPSSHANHAMGR